MSRNHTVLAVTSVFLSSIACILALVVVGNGGFHIPWKPQGPPLWISVGLWTSFVINLLGMLLLVPLIGQPLKETDWRQPFLLMVGSFCNLSFLYSGMVMYEVVTPGSMGLLCFPQFILWCVTGIYEALVRRRRVRRSQEANPA